MCNEEPFLENINFLGFYKTKSDIFCLFFLWSPFGVILRSFFSLYDEKLLSGFFHYSEVKRDEQTQATDLSLKNNRDVLLNSPVNF